MYYTSYQYRNHVSTHFNNLGPFFLKPVALIISNSEMMFFTCKGVINFTSNMRPCSFVSRKVCKEVNLALLNSTYPLKK